MLLLGAPNLFTPPGGDAPGEGGFEMKTTPADKGIMAAKMENEALPKFNWGASALDANAIRLLNEVPAKVRTAIAKAEGRA